MFKPSYRALYQFSIAASEASFSSAADRLGISQPTLSQQIAKLERGIGKKLFHRNGRTLNLTPIGKQLLDEIGASFNQIDLAWSETCSSANARDSLLIASVHTLFNYYLPEVLMDFLDQIPNVQPDVRGRSSSEVIALALNRSIDIGLVYDTEHVHSELTSHLLFQEKIVAVFHPKAPWAEDLILKREIPQNTPLSVFQRGYALRSLLNRAYLNRALNIFAETDNIELMLRFAQAQLCVALLPQGVANQFGERRGLISCDLQFPSLKRNVVAVWHRAEPLRPPAKAFLTICTANDKSNSNSA